MTTPDQEAVPSPATRKLPSASEIAVLEALAEEGEPIVAQLASGVVAFHTRLLLVDPQREFVLLQASTDTAANAALLSGPHARLLAEMGEWRIEFSGENPQPVAHEGARAIRLAFPQSVSINRRRQVDRMEVPPHSLLRCVGNVGGAPSFTGAVIDISEGGIGILQEFSRYPLGPGTMLKGYRLERPGRDPLIVDLEVRYVEPRTAADGKQAPKVGCRFAELTPQVLELIAEFAGHTS